MRSPTGTSTTMRPEIGTTLGYWARHFATAPTAAAVAPATDDPAALLTALREHLELCRLGPAADRPAVALDAGRRGRAGVPGRGGPARSRAGPAGAGGGEGVAGIDGRRAMTFEAVRAESPAPTGSASCAPGLARRGAGGGGSATSGRRSRPSTRRIGAPALPSDDRLEEERRQPCPGWAEIGRRRSPRTTSMTSSFTFSALEEGRPLRRPPLPGAGRAAGGADPVSGALLLADAKLADGRHVDVLCENGRVAASPRRERSAPAPRPSNSSGAPCCCPASSRGTSTSTRRCSASAACRIGRATRRRAHRAREGAAPRLGADPSRARAAG